MKLWSTGLDTLVLHSPTPLTRAGLQIELYLRKSQGRKILYRRKYLANCYRCSPQKSYNIMLLPLLSTAVIVMSFEKVAVMLQMCCSTDNSD